TFSTGTGGIDLINTGALTLTNTVTFLDPAQANAGIGAGNFTLTVAETNDPATAADDLTVLAGVTVQSTGGAVTLNAGDDVIVQAGATVRAAGLLTVRGGFNDLDSRGCVQNLGSLIGGGGVIVSSPFACFPTPPAPNCT